MTPNRAKTRKRRAGGCSQSASSSGGHRAPTRASTSRSPDGGSASPLLRRHGATVASAQLDELLQAAQPERHRLALVSIAPIGERDFAHIDVAARIDGEPVRGKQLASLEPGRPVTQSRQHLALVTVDADPRPDVRHVEVDPQAAADLPAIEAGMRAALEE